MDRAFVSINSSRLHQVSDEALLGRLTAGLTFSVDPGQRSAWIYELRQIRDLAVRLPNAHFFMEFLIPRMGRRADLIVLISGIVFVVEYKLGSATFDRSAVDQVFGYALDLKNFHQTSHNLPIVPILVAADAPLSTELEVQWDDDGVSRPLKLIPSDLGPMILQCCSQISSRSVDANAWQAGQYKPTPTIVEAAQALYANHNVEEISRSEAGAENLTRTSIYISNVIDRSKALRQKSICFVTGVPGSGKTLAGLNLATQRKQSHHDEHAVFLSGNGPLVAVLREALAQDAVRIAKTNGQPASKTREYARTSAFIQNIHHFRDECLRTDTPPIERVAVFDEAQRAWDEAKTVKFMKAKKGVLDFAMSESAFLLSAMNRHEDWCTVVCLVGGGQEINEGEAGIDEWLRSIKQHFPHWHVYLSDKLDAQFEGINVTHSDCLHLATSIRSFRAERLSEFVEALLDGRSGEAKEILRDLDEFPIVTTRNIESARSWVRDRRRGLERAGLLASSNANRLKPHGVFVQHRIEPENWFLSPVYDVRSSDALEDVATEFDVQGLELDWTAVCWDANLCREGDGWKARRFSGTNWQSVNQTSRQTYIRNAYRVLLTRARQGMVIFVPSGDINDVTRDPATYDKIADYLNDCGIAEIVDSCDATS